MKNMSNQVPGLATRTIDFFYEAKLKLCEEWDRNLGLSESHVLSAVKLLKECYFIRRPIFQAMDRYSGAYKS